MPDYSEPDRGRGVSYWEYDPVLQRQIDRVYTDDDRDYAAERLADFGRMMGETIAENSDVIDQSPPELDTYDRDGDVVNRVRRHPLQHENERLTFEHGAVADSFQPPEGRDEPLPLTQSLAYYYLICYSDIGLGCCVSMTGGTALVLEQFGEGLEDEFELLTSRDYDDHGQGAMFITEEQGGSDVGRNETVAEPTEEEGVYELTGEKWFCSNIDAEVPLVLARTPDAPDGTAGLSMFVVPPEIDGEPNGVVFRRLKDKLGTKSVPTGEVELEGARGHLVGEEERGFKYMTAMLNYERVTNAMGSTGIIARAVLEAKVRAAEREAFGKPLNRHPLMQADLVDMTVRHEAATAFSFDSADALDAYYRGGDEDAYALMRGIVPVAKYRTGELAVELTSYCMEVLGGNGYTENWVTERLLRDAQVAPIWEGTSNILSLDLVKAFWKEASHEAILSQIDSYIADAEHSYLLEVAGDVEDRRDEFAAAVDRMATEGEEYAELYAKRAADLVYESYAGALLVSEAQEALDGGDARGALVARRFVDIQDDGVRGDTLQTDAYEAIAEFEPADPAVLD